MSGPATGAPSRPYVVAVAGAVSPTVGSLFSGIGGLDLGLERAGFRIEWQCECDPFCRRVLASHWPGVPCHEAVEAIRAPTDVRPVDVLCGGFPCQPVSLAGNKRGPDDDRWLWPEMGRVVRLLRPRVVVVENVPGLFVRGMGDVVGELAGGGYCVEWDCIPAAFVGAPHLRYRVFVVAYSDGARLEGPGGTPPDEPRERAGRPAVGGAVADADGGGCEGVGVAEPSGVEGAFGRVFDRRRPYGGFDYPAPDDVADADFPGGDGGYRLHDEGSTEHGGPGPSGGDSGRRPVGPWSVESAVGRMANGVPGRVDSLRTLGNAVVPQVAEYVGRRILEAWPS
jgi:DNA (cytosine-5)-methyltransferase 1